MRGYGVSGSERVPAALQGKYDEIVVSTLPTGASKWLQIDLPRSVQRITGVQVEHVVAAPRPAHA